MARKTNQELAKEQNTTTRQIAKSRRRGWIKTHDGKIVQYRAPEAVHIVPKKKRLRTKFNKNHT